MAHDDFVEEYNALFVRFIKHLKLVKFDRSLLVNQKNDFQARFDMHLHNNQEFFEELKTWPEWINLQKKVTQAGGEIPNPYFVLGYQFSDIFNSIPFLDTVHSPRFAQKLPHLRTVCRNPSLLKKGLLEGAMNLSEAKDDHFVILIQGLKVPRKIEIDDYGHLAPVDQAVNEYKSFWYNTGEDNHLYAGFYANSKAQTDDNFIVRLMSSLRTFKQGDVRYLNVLQGCEDFVREIVYRNHRMATSSKDYHEETAYFGTRAPQLPDVKEDETGALKSHIKSFIEGSKDMIFCCNYFNKAMIAAEHIRLPMMFFALESCFPDKSEEKSKKMAQFTAVCLGKDDKFVEVMKLFYDLRSSVVHGDEKEYGRIQRKLAREHPEVPSRVETLKHILVDLFVALAARNWKPKRDIKRLRESVGI